MSTERELLEIEQELAGGGGEEYKAHLAEEAVVIIPGGALDKRETVEAMQQTEGWDKFRIDEPRVLELGPAGAVLTYRFTGRRGSDYTYHALMSSAYERTNGGWKLALHQQTPISGD